jgi:oxygen-dependent protoporphyrinogen oxidase
MAPTRFWPLLTTPLFSWPGKLRMALDLVLPRGPGGDETLAAFVTRRLGREALERVAQPLVGGIYTADPRRLGLAATMPRFLEMERASRSVILAMWRQQRAAAQRSRDSGARWSLFLSFDDGLQTLVDELARRLPDSTVQLARPITRIERRDGGGWRLDGACDCDALIIATPAHAAAALVRDLDTTLAGALEAIPYASSATVTLAFRREDIPHPLDGFGFVVPQVERRALLAGTFSSLKYPGRAPAEWVLVRAFVGGALQPELVELDDAALVATVRRDLGHLLGVHAAPALVRVARWRRAMPQYEIGHLERVAAIRDRAAALGLHLAGNAYDGVGIPDCIRSGETAADAVFGVSSPPS